jgi:Pyruvate/2-oxoacid:ferredoxin oxidoreductase delta subunit
MENIIRKIVKIDADKCNGCGDCILSCSEGALQVVDGKARLISEVYCDGLGACLGECPQGAISIEERKAESFDEEAAKLSARKTPAGKEEFISDYSSAVKNELEKSEAVSINGKQTSMLEHWPVQLTLVSPSAPFLKAADLILAGDCVPFAYAEFHRDFLAKHSLLVACPKLDDFQAHLTKLTEILKRANVKSLTIVHMEVPCCSGLAHMARLAMQQSVKVIPVREVTISAKGEIL